MSDLSGAQVIAEYLIREQVPYAVGLCGHGDLGLLDALYERRDEITTISMHHESLAGFVADAYFRVRRQPLATFTSCGPGSANLPVALGSALMDDSAFLAITGNVPTSQFNRGPFQETGRHHQADFSSVVRPYVKRSFQATRAEQLPLMLRQSFATMLGGRPGPVHLDVPLNVFVETTSEPLADPRAWTAGLGRASGAAARDVDEILSMLAGAERPVIVAGSGLEIYGGSEALLRLARSLRIPVVTSPLGKATIAADDPLALGATGRNGTLAANKAARNADLILALGTRFDDRSTSSWLEGYTYTLADPKVCSLIHIHVDAAELGRNYPATLGIQADPAEVARQLASAWADYDRRASTPDRSGWLNQVQAWRTEWEELVAPHRGSDAVPIRPERLIAELRRALPADGILLSDVGIHHNWIVQEWRASRPRGVLQSWGFASMGFGLGGAIGAHLAEPETPVVGVVGDGGFMMLPSAVATAVEYGFPVTWVVWNNRGYMSIRDQQRLYFGADRELATSFRMEATGEPYRVQAAEMARAMGATGIRVGSPGDLGSVLEQAVATPGPVVVDVSVDDAVGLPAVATWDLPPKPHPTPRVGWPD